MLAVAFICIALEAVLIGLLANVVYELNGVLVAYMEDVDSHEAISKMIKEVKDERTERH